MKKLGKLQYLGISLLAAAWLVVMLAPAGPAHASTTNQSNTDITAQVAQPGKDAEPEAANFQGKVVSLNGTRFILRDDANGTWYHLDNQKVAAQYAGKMVVVIGILDARSAVIRVRSIHESA